MDKASLIRLIRQARFNFALWRADDLGKAQIYRRFLGVKFGRNCRITGNIKFSSEPYLIEIGDDVTLTDNIVFHTHDGGVHVLRKQCPVLNVFGRIRIGNNVFIGSDVILLPGVTIGDNVVIGAGSVVARDIPSGTVAAGVPARVIKTLDTYREECMRDGMTLDETEPAHRKEVILKALRGRAS